MVSGLLFQIIFINEVFDVVQDFFLVRWGVPYQNLIAIFPKLNCPENQTE